MPVHGAGTPAKRDAVLGSSPNGAGHTPPQIPLFMRPMCKNACAAPVCFACFAMFIMLR